MTTASPKKQQRRLGNSTELTLNRLRAAIQNGEFAPGQRLIEADLMKAFSVTRGPLREALRRLGVEGVVELVPNRGAMVKAFSRDELIDLFRIRESIEGLAARLAAEQVGEKGLAQGFMQGYEKIQSQNSDAASRFGDENRAFHDLIVQFADNPQLTLLMQRLQLPIIRYQIRAALDEDYRKESRQEHQAVFEAIARGDADGAESSMRAHLRRAAERIKKISPAFRE